MRSNTTLAFSFLTIVLCTPFLFGQHSHDDSILGGVKRIGAYENFVDFGASIVIGEQIEYQITSSFSQGADEDIQRIESKLWLPFVENTVPYAHVFSPPIPAHDPNHADGEGLHIEFSTTIQAGQTGFAAFRFESSIAVDVNGDEHDVFLSPIVNMIVLDVRKRGDMNGDNQVDFADFLLFSAAYDSAGNMVGYEGGDFNLDGVIDFADFLILSAGFGN